MSSQRVCCEKGKLNEVHHLMEQRGIYYSLLQSSMEKKDLVGGRKLHRLIAQDGLYSDPVLCSHLIRMYAACGRILEAIQVFLQTPTSNAFTWSAIISSHAKLGQGEQALTLFHEMQRASLEPDKHVLLAVLKGCSSIAALDHGKLIHFHVLINGLAADLSLSNCLIDTYAKCRSLLDARNVFEKLANRDTITWSALMTGYAQHGRGHEALMLYCQMQQEGVEPNRVTVISILKACSTIVALEQSKFIHAYILEKGFESDRVVCNTLIDVYAKCGSLKEAHRVFLKLTNQDAVSWNAIIAAYALHGHGERSLGLFHQMQQEAIKPDKFTIVSVLKACSTIGALKEGKIIHAYFVESGFEPDAFINNTLVDMYSKCGDLEEAHRLFNRLPERSVVTWSAMIAGHALHGQDHEAFEVFLQMQKEKKKPDNFTYGSILKACSNMKALNKGKLIHEHIIENSSELDVVVASALIDMYIKCNSLEDARMLFDKLSKRDVVTWSAIITGYVQLGAAQEALGLFQQMLQERVKPNGVTFMSSLKACSSIAALHEGSLIHGQIIESGLELDRLIGNTLIDMYSKCGSLGDACQVFANMSDKDVVTWNALIAGFALQSNYGLALQHFESMQREGLKPDDVTFLSLLSTCNHLGLVDQGCQHFVSMEKVFGIIPTQEHFNCIVDLFGRTGHLKEAGDLLQLIPFETGTVGWMSLLSNCSNHGNPNLGRQCFDCVVDMDISHAPSYVHMSNIYGNVAMWKEASKISELRSYAAFGWKKPGKAWIEVNNKVFDFMVGDQSHPQSIDVFAKLKRLTEEIVDKGHVPHFTSMVQSMFEKVKISH